MKRLLPILVSFLTLITMTPALADTITIYECELVPSDASNFFTRADTSCDLDVPSTGSASSILLPKAKAAVIDNSPSDPVAPVDPVEPPTDPIDPVDPIEPPTDPVDPIDPPTDPVTPPTEPEEDEEEEDDTRPGHGHGDNNHNHSGPPGKDKPKKNR
jgi:hypothetical protein